MTELSRYLFSVLREGELALYRGSGDSLEPMLLVAPVGEYSAHESRAMAGMTLVLEHQKLCPAPEAAHGSTSRGDGWFCLLQSALWCAQVHYEQGY